MFKKLFGGGDEELSHSQPSGRSEEDIEYEGRRPEDLELWSVNMTFKDGKNAQVECQENPEVRTDAGDRITIITAGGFVRVKLKDGTIVTKREADAADGYEISFDDLESHEVIN